MADNFFARTENNTSVLNSQNVYWPKIWHRLEGTEMVSGWERSLAIHRRKLEELRLGGQGEESGARRLVKAIDTGH